MDDASELARLEGIIREVYFWLGPPQPTVPYEGVPALVRAAMAERDRLRVVVDAAREVDRRAREAERTGAMVVTPPWFGQLRDALAALDVGGGSTDE